jgi:CDP-6-deoxy-D-xylo-4-hexulose-3-dehydrase
LIEDNCESLGATLYKKQTGTIGIFGTFSFFFSHHLQTMEGGMIVTDDDTLADYMRSLRAHGWIRDLRTSDLYTKSGNAFEDSFKFVLPGYCVRPLEMSGAIGSVQLKKMDKMISKRRENAEVFFNEFL